LRREHAVADDPQLTVLLGHENGVGVGEGDAPGVEQATRHGHDADLAALHIKDLRAGIARWRGLLGADGQSEQDGGDDVRHGSHEVLLHNASARRWRES
jgi:hypothetical protein